MTIRIKAGCEEAYRKHHKAVWPEVVEMIRACKITNYSIFLKDGRLYSHSNMLVMTSRAIRPRWPLMPKRTNGGPLLDPCRSLWRRANRANGGQKWKKCFIRSNTFSKAALARIQQSAMLAAFTEGATSLIGLLLPGCAVWKAKALERLWLDLDAISGLLRHSVVPSTNLHRRYKVLMQMVDILNDTIFKRS
jgi:hypothetical protein